MIYRVGWGPLHGRPMISSKINTLLQLLYVLAVVAHAGYGLPSAGVLDVLAVLTLCTVLLSGYLYALRIHAAALAVARA